MIRFENLTDRSVTFVAVNASTGARETGLVRDDVERIVYRRDIAAPQSVLEASMADVTPDPQGAHIDNGFIEIDAANLPGHYRVDFPDAAFAEGAELVTFEIIFEVAAGVIVDPVIVELQSDALAEMTLHSGTAQAGGASTITLANAASSVDDYYGTPLVVIYAGTGAGQYGQMSSYVGATRVATMDAAWAVQPDNTSKYRLIPEALAAAGGTDFSAGERTQILTNLDATMSSRASAADLATHDGNLGTVSTQVAAIPTTDASLDATETAAAVWDALLSAYTTTGSFGEFLQAITSGGTPAATTVAALMAEQIESGGDQLTFVEVLRLLAARNVGESTVNTGSGAVEYKAAGDSATTRIAGTGNADGERSSITLTPA